MINPTDLNALAADMTKWRRALHAVPETAFEERLTSDFVAGKLADFGLPIVRGIAGTGLVATLKGRRGDGPSVGLRAHDALDIHENNDLPYRSRFQDKMHACGHDGHMAMLLGAAYHLSATPDFAGTLHFIFQPSEENAGGGRVMLEEGLFERFPVAPCMDFTTGPTLGGGGWFEFVRLPNVLALFCLGDWPGGSWI